MVCTLIAAGLMASIGCSRNHVERTVQTERVIPEKVVVERTVERPADRVIVEERTQLPDSRVVERRTLETERRGLLGNTVERQTTTTTERRY